MQKYYHSVTLDRDKCRGCTNCIKKCPTEAIRVRDGKARIIAERCIDCGECIRVCPYHAKIAVTDPLSSIDNFKYSIALPAPALYGQFKNLKDVDRVLHGLMLLGFDDVFEVARGADYVTAMTRHIIKEGNYKKPMISSACPTVVRLIQVRFPELIPHLAPVESPMEIGAQMAKHRFCDIHGVEKEDIGVFFITPCAAKMTAIRNPIGTYKSEVNGAISILDIYGPLSSVISKEEALELGSHLQHSTLKGVSWANSGGEGGALGIDNFLAVDGINNVIKVLEEIENGRISDLDFFEGLACTGGCVGGPLVFDNNFVAQNRLKRLIRGMEPPKSISPEDLKIAMETYNWKVTREILPKPVMKLDDDITLAIKKMEELESIYADLPGLDCGSCGSPGCRSLAEDIVRGNATEMDCIIRLREKVRDLARGMIEISEDLPIDQKKEKGKGENR